MFLHQRRRSGRAEDWGDGEDAKGGASGESQAHRIAGKTQLEKPPLQYENPVIQNPCPVMDESAGSAPVNSSVKKIKVSGRQREAFIHFYWPPCFKRLHVFVSWWRSLDWNTKTNKDDQINCLVWSFFSHISLWASINFSSPFKFPTIWMQLPFTSSDYQVCSVDLNHCLAGEEVTDLFPIVTTLKQIYTGRIWITTKFI